MQITREFHSKTLQRSGDPDIFMTDLEALKVKMEEVGHELNNLPEQYEMEIKILKHQIQLLKDAKKKIL
jgi:transposase-like protein